ncbi:MAG: helix-turn-helix transcriptional regulator [Chitinophagaceae bacterium]
MKSRNYLNGGYKLKIGGNIRKWRNLKGIKQKELAVILELSEAAISNIENNNTDITLSQLEDISTGLNISVEQLFCDPQENFSASLTSNVQDNKYQQSFLEKDLLNAMIKSMQQKDEQLQVIMQNVLHTMTTIVRADNGSRKGSGINT